MHVKIIIFAQIVQIFPMKNTTNFKSKCYLLNNISYEQGIIKFQTFHILK